jgi:spermidine/putrescine transport system permease protein
LLGFTLLIIGISYLPIFSLVFFSFEASEFAQLPLTGFTMRWWQDMANSVQLLGSVRASIYVALESAGITILLSAPAAYAITRFRIPGRGLIIFMSILPMLIPEFILGMSILLTFDAVGTPLSLHTIAMGHATLALPFVFLTILAQQYGFDRNTEEAAKDLGAGPLKSFIKITLPPMLTAVAAAAFLAITVSFGDYVVAFLLTGTTTTLPVYIFGLLKSGVSPTVNAAGSMLLFGIVIVILVAIVRPWRFAIPLVLRLTHYIYVDRFGTNSSQM